MTKCRNPKKMPAVLPQKIADLPVVNSLKVGKSGEIYRSVGNAYLLIPQNKVNGYLAVAVQKNRKQERFYVHRLVAEAYIPNPKKKPEVNHIDGNKLNNSVTNLEWATRRENSHHAFENGLIPTIASAGKPCTVCGDTMVLRASVCQSCKQKALREESMNAILKQREVQITKIIAHSTGLSERDAEILSMRYAGYTLQSIANNFGVSRQRISQLLSELQKKSERSVGKVTLDDQRKLFEFIFAKGIKITAIAEATGQKYYRLHKWKTLISAMDTAIYASICEFVGYCTDRRARDDSA